MALTLDHFIAATAGHTTSEVYLKRQSGRAEGARIDVRGRIGRFMASPAQLRQDRAEIAQVFHDAVLEKIHSQIMLLQGTGDTAHSLYQRNLRNLVVDIGASLETQMRGDRALTANDIRVLTMRVNSKLAESTSKAIAIHSAAVNRKISSTLPQAEARIASAWEGLCPGVSRPSDFSGMAQAIKAYCATRPDIANEKLAMIDEYLSRAEATLGEDLPKKIALAEELEGLHKGLLGYSVDLAVRRSTVDLSSTTTLGQGAYGKVTAVTVGGEEKVHKALLSGGPNYIELDPSAPLNDPKLKRDTELTAAYLRDGEKTFIVAPSHYLVSEDHPYKPSILRWVVEVRDKEFRAWAKDQLIKNKKFPSYRLNIVGQLQDKAEGHELHAACESGVIAPDMIQPIALSYLNTLIAMAKRGFVHGDIKPKNTFFDPATNRLKLIDTGGLTKISKDSARKDQTSFVNQRGFTPAYSLPITAGAEKVGFEHDLFSTGMSILEIALKQKGRGALVAPLLEHFHENAIGFMDGLIPRDQALNEVERYLDKEIAPGASPEELAAINVIKRAVGLARVGRSSDGTTYIPQVLDQLKSQF